MIKAEIFLQKRTSEAAMEEIRARRKTEPTDAIYRTTLHWHDYFELELIVGGTGEHRLNGRSYPVARGDVFLLTPRDLHTLVEQPDAPMQLYNLNFEEAALPPSLAEHLINRENELTFRLDEEHTKKATSLFEDILAEQQQPDAPFHRERTRALLSELLVLLLRREASTQHTVTVHTREGRRDPIPETIAYLRAHFRESVTLEECAARVFLTAGYLGELFYQSTGSHFKEYLQRLRFEYAQRLLRTTALTIHAVARESGFSTPSYFISGFRARYGKTPNEYRCESHS